MSDDRPSTPSTGGGGGKLETLSKEDLIKFAKRQTMLFSKAKAKIEGWLIDMTEAYANYSLAAYFVTKNWSKRLVFQWIWYVDSILLMGSLKIFGF